MKKIYKITLPLLLVLFIVLLPFVGLFNSKSALAYTSSQYRFALDHYSITYDIGSNCSIKVTEDIIVHYYGYSSTGFVRSIPVSKGVQVRDVKVVKLEKGVTSNAWYKVYFEYGVDEDGNSDLNDAFLCVDMGDSSIKTGQTENYVITYTYNIMNSVVKNGNLPLNPIGTGWDCEINNAKIELIAPASSPLMSIRCYSGTYGSTNEYTDFEEKTVDNRTHISATFDYLKPYTGVTFKLEFKDGTIAPYSSFSPSWTVIVAIFVGLLLLGALAGIKFAFFNKVRLLPIVNYTAPDNMDPLLMGKLIDNQVDKEDVTSLIYYWASKGYIKINMEDKKDPAFIRITQQLPDTSPKYEKHMYSKLFESGDMVKTSQLKNKFYKTVDETTMMLNKGVKDLYNKMSLTIPAIFSLFSGLILGLIPMAVAFFNISHKMLFFYALIAIIPAFVAQAFTQWIKYSWHKHNKTKRTIFCYMIAGIILVLGFVYCVAIPSSLLGMGAKIIIYIFTAPLFIAPVWLVTRTEKYNEVLGNIIGFKQFLTLAEKAELEMMLEKDPQFYYRILPYAQVLGVSDIWENKFKALTMEPPHWLSGNYATGYLEFYMINSMLRSSMNSINSGMVSRPSSSGSHGGGFGGGGFSGGGFGGGGGHGR